VFALAQAAPTDLLQVISQGGVVVLLLVILWGGAFLSSMQQFARTSRRARMVPGLGLRARVSGEGRARSLEI
jgi:hypothetical protein